MIFSVYIHLSQLYVLNKVSHISLSSAAQGKVSFYKESGNRKDPSIRIIQYRGKPSTLQTTLCHHGL